MSGTVTATFLVLSFLGSGGGPTGTDTAEHFARGRICAEALDYACAEDELGAARLGVDTLDEAQRIDLWRLSAEIALAGDKSTEALEHLGALLALDPGFTPPPGTWPPPWLAVLRSARASAPDRSPPDLELRSVGPGREGEPVEIVVHARDRSGVGGVKAFVHTEGGPKELPLSTSDGLTWRVGVPAGLVRAPVLRYWIEAYDTEGNGPARVGSAEAPGSARVAPRAAEQGSIFSRWWFWTAVGATVAAGSAAAWALTHRPGGDGRGVSAADFNDVEVRLIWPSLH